jgi:hypothetical protein
VQYHTADIIAYFKKNYYDFILNNDIMADIRVTFHTLADVSLKRADFPERPIEGRRSLGAVFCALVPLRPFIKRKRGLEG